MASGLPDCPQCHLPIHADWPYCSHCGSRLWSGPIPPPPIPICKHCGAQVDPTGSFCWWCGVPVFSGREPILPGKSEPSPPSDTVVEAPSVSVSYVHAAPAKLSAPPSKSRPPARRPVLGASLVVVGILILLVSLFVGWYTISSTATDTVSGSSFTGSATATLYPLNYLTETFNCQGSSYCFSNSTYTGAYAQSSFSSLGALYDAIAGLLIGGAALGCAAVALAFAGGYRKRVWAGRLALLAVVMVVLAPTVLAIAQPSVLGSQGTSSSGASPQTSFAGSCSQSGCGNDLAPGATASASWGPSIGWYLGFAAVVPLLLGWLELRARRKQSAAAEIYHLAR